MNSTEWYPKWVKQHCQAMGAFSDTNVVQMFLLVKDSFIVDLKATLGELDECTRRMVTGSRVPKFPNEQTNAVTHELKMLREERTRGAQNEAVRNPASCSICGGVGLAIIPMPECVRNGQLVRHPDSNQVATCSVPCDTPGCIEGMNVAQKEATKDPQFRRPTLSQCVRWSGGCDLVGMLREHEKAKAEVAKKGRPAALAKILSSLMKKFNIEG